ncbi:hypothetical protein [Streptomyces europaeiscabiei]|uniref:Uncharacterized protein n=1 Tax=Streptomyces europaeiscabiei TaxID=146819 RepID=A0ABU4NNH4_9ACTN|nr:hypothetical protein [Streptomyces europaeiscabiei]MDX2528495.1 hypothetical protein [Streptomyces europaeiscabiei]MDX3546238.1 hypothetical protein [Streptomyces europaeiscabiei]MDX3557456.1 hypothetical protein [Streptomyces europaeiscabiei]MDX3703637.1 hypothetical protein [Streptomyces europaeiscabiei]
MSAETLVQTPVQRALTLQIQAGAPLPKGKAKRIADEIIESAAAADKTVEEYLVDYAKGLDVKALREGMKSAFWSYGIPHPNLPSDKVLSSQHLAAIWSDMENDNEADSARYLEGTPGGKDLGELHLWNPQVQTALGFLEDDGDVAARKAWGALSENYAKATDGEAIVFAGELAPWSVAYETELPQLRRTIGAENIHFMYDLSEQTLEGLPPESQQLLSEGRVRSHVHFFAPNAENPPPEKYWESGYLDLDHVKSLPTPEAQRAAILEVCERVALLDRQQVEAETQAEQNQDLSADQEVTATGIEEQQPSATSVPEQTPPAPAAESDPRVFASTHGAFMPGVEVNAKVGPLPIQPLEASAQASGADFMPGVTLKPAPAPVTPTPVAPAPAQAPTAPEQAQDTGMGV